jgi:hypothetical protein
MPVSSMKTLHARKYKGPKSRLITEPLSRVRLMRAATETDHV